MTKVPAAGLQAVSVARRPLPLGGIPKPLRVFSGLVGAAVLGTFAYAGYKLIQGATSGYPIAEVRQSQFAAYDHSRDGVIDLDPSIERQEFIRYAEHDEPFQDDNSMFKDTYWTVEDGSARFVAADANADARVTADEFDAFLTTYDLDGNGKLKLGGGELHQLERDHPEVRVGRSSMRPRSDDPFVPTTPLPSSPGDR